ncbi:MAG TPA: iron-sulfur cluster assembly accessory protein [Burkholderiales bacterium]|nr:iron-sulfur cluster assembly accessory protein [Burkholderiales bacterium]
MCVEMTDRAALFVRRMLKFGGGGGTAGLRLRVTPGGCSGYASEFSVEQAPAPGESVVETHGVRLFLPPDTCELLRGHVMDYEDSRLDGGLSFRRPGAAQACGCGSGAGAERGTARVALPRPGGSCGKRG